MAIRFRLRMVLGAAAMLAATGCAGPHYLGYAPQPGAGRGDGDDGFASAMLALHNGERVRLGLEPMQWDPTLAAASDGYAGTLAATGIFRHSARSTRQGQGENLWTGTRGAFGHHQMVGGWLGEKPLYQPGVFPNVSRNGNWAAVGHYTQIIWRGTTNVGCAVRSSMAFDYLVCRYSPPGNIFGKTVS